MTLAEPFWLILLIPLGMLLWLFRLPSRLMLALRAIGLAAILLGLCGLGIVLPVRSGTVVLVADRSLSMPADAEPLEKEAAGLLGNAMQTDDKLAVVSFAEATAVEQPPQASKFSEFSAEVGHDASHLADALDVALSLVERQQSGRILVLSDGRWTGRDVAASAARAAAAGVAIDYRAIERSTAGDLAVERVQAPESVAPGESFMITGWVSSPRGQTISYKLLRSEHTIAEGKMAMPAGSSRLIFRDTAGQGGTCQYVLQVEGSEPDPVPGNNRARLLVGVRGSRPLLCVNPGKAAALPDLLAKGGLPIETRSAAQCQWTLEELGSYSGVLLENTPASMVGHVGMENLSAWVTQTGSGLMLTGGRDSYGAGGYFKSPLEKILPVSMELRREHRKMALAIVVALDRSGSMAMTLSDGRAKIELADLATAEVLGMLSPMDQFGCIAVDTAPHMIVPLSDVVEPDSMRRKILRIDSAGGGIYIHEAMETAGAMLAGAKTGVKHIILFADAADSRQHPGDYRRLAAQCLKAGITTTVIGLGTPKDRDADILKDLAQRGGGQCMFTNVAQELPRLFAQDTFVISRSAFVDEPTAIRSAAGMVSITPQALGALPQIGGYNLCYLRPEANLAIVSEDEYKSPVLSSWQAGSGRVLCYTGEADGQYTGPIARWGNVGNFFTSLARWTVGKGQELGPGVAATEELRNGVCRIELHLDPARDNIPFSRLPELNTLSARPGEAAVAKKTRMGWLTPDSLLAEIPLAGTETVLPTVEIAGVGRATLAPMCLPYSPEFVPQKAGQGAAALERLAKATGGCERVNLTEIWKDVPRRPHHVLLAPYLLLAGVTLFLAEVFQRRTGLLAIRGKLLERLRQIVGRRDTDRAPLIRRRKTKRSKPEPIELPLPAPPKPAAPTPAKPVKKSTGAEAIDDALTQAQNRARRRTDRK